MESCFYCKGAKIATCFTAEGVPSCQKHRHETDPVLCPSCNKPLYAEKGRYGTYFNCLEHGNFSLKKVLMSLKE